MRQSSVIFASLLFGFVIYITVRGQLPAYLALFSKGKTEYSPAGNGGENSVFGPGTEAIRDAMKRFLGGAN